MPAPVLQFKRGNAGVAGTVPALRPGEPAISLNNFDFFIGIDTSVANNKFFGSHRYWGREDGTNSLRLKLVDKDGTNYIAIKAPDTLAGIVTYRLPGTQGTSSSVLTNDGSGNLSWSSGSANPVFSGIATFSDTTDNTLGDPNTGAVQIDGGVGIEKNLTVGAGLSVGGQSYFIGTATFYGGTLNLGDGDTDNINVAGEFVSNLIPNTDATYDLGTGSKRWRNASFSGIVTATTFSGNASSADQVKTVTATDAAANYYVTFVDSHNGSATNETVYTDDGIYYNPGTNTFTTQYALFTADINVSGVTSSPTVKTATIQHSTGTQAATIDSSGNITASQNLTVSGDLFVNGNTTQVNTTELTIYDRTITLGVTTAGTTPTTTSWDLGVLMNYGDAGVAKTAGVIWKYGNNDVERFQFATNTSNPGSGGNTNDPDITVATFAPIEIGALWVTDCAGTSQVISCTGAERFLENITVDAGTF
jgi:hypothetical protein